MRQLVRKFWQKSVHMLGGLISVSALSACGLSPVYQQTGIGSESVQDELAQISVAPIADQRGQILRNHLLNLLNPDGQPADPLYRLEAFIEETSQELVVQRDDSAVRNNLIVDVHFTLENIETGQEIFARRVGTVSGYNVLSDAYASEVTEQNARERALVQLAQDVKTRLALFFNQTDRE